MVQSGFWNPTPISQRIQVLMRERLEEAEKKRGG
jgi:hypothetical protein